MAGLGLGFDFITVDNATTIGIRTDTCTTRDSSGRLIFGRLNDLERADSAAGPGPSGGFGLESDPGPVIR